jgi:hypothetical protein
LVTAVARGVAARLLCVVPVTPARVRRRPRAMAIHGADAACVMLLFSVAFFCARFLLDRLVYKV